MSRLLAAPSDSAPTPSRYAATPARQTVDAEPSARRPDAASRTRSAIVVAHPYAAAAGLPPQLEHHLGDRTPLLMTSVTAAFRAAHANPGHSDLVVVHLEGVDRFRDGWAGHRLIERLIRSGDAEVVAWVGEADLDGQALAERLGARVVTTANRQPALAADEPLAEWFRRRHLAPWHDWMVVAAVALASAADRASQATHCREAWRLESNDAAHRRLRRLRAILCEETREHPGLEQRLAVEVLRAASAHGSINVEPIVIRSVHVAARALRSNPAAVPQLGLTEREAADVIAVADAATALRERVPSSSGRPAADTWLVRRLQAIGRLASERTDSIAAAERERERIVDHLERSLLTVHDAIEDGELAPNPARTTSPAGASPAAEREGATPR